jgi:HSP20 family protein
MRAVSLYQPVDFGRTLDSLDRFVESFLCNNAERSLTRSVGRVPPVDVIEKDDAYVLEAELPGYAEDDIHVSLDGGTITIEAASEKETEKSKDGKQDERYVVRERSSASFCRTFRLPENADTETITAGFKNGLLSMEIKKRTEAQKRMIQIAKA